MTASDMECARALILSGDVTFAAVKGGAVITDTARGIRPLVAIYEREESLSGFSIADKVVGKAAAFLYAALGADELYADVISEQALGVLRKYGVLVSYSELVPAIINRDGTGYCPMESAVMKLENVIDAIPVIRKLISKLDGKSTVSLDFFTRR